MTLQGVSSGQTGVSSSVCITAGEKRTLQTQISQAFKVWEADSVWPGMPQTESVLLILEGKAQAFCSTSKFMRQRMKWPVYSVLRRALASGNIQWSKVHDDEGALIAAVAIIRLTQLNCVWTAKSVWSALTERPVGPSGLVWEEALIEVGMCGVPQGCVSGLIHVVSFRMRFHCSSVHACKCLFEFLFIFVTIISIYD